MEQDSRSLGNRLQNINTQLQGMTPVDQSAVTDDLMRRVDYFRPQFEELRSAEQSAFASPGQMMEQFYNRGMTGGASDTGPSAMGMYNSIIGNVGQQMGTVDTLNDILRAQQGRIGQMAQNAFDSYNTQRSGLIDQRDYFTNLYQNALQREQAERARARAAAAARQQQLDMRNYVNRMAQQIQPQPTPPPRTVDIGQQARDAIQGAAGVANRAGEVTGLNKLFSNPLTQKIGRRAMNSLMSPSIESRLRDMLIRR